MRTVRLLTLVGILGVIFLLPQATFASSDTLQVSPAYVDISLPEVTSREEIAIQYKNNSQQEMTLELFPIDFRQSGPFGQIGFLGTDASQYSYSLASFLSFETNRLDLAPMETRTVKIVASNRKDLTPGGHYAAVVAKMAQEKEDTTLVAPAVSTLIYLRKVGGERYHLSLNGVSYPKSTVVFSTPSTMTLLFQNEGNTHLIPFGRVTITDMFGRVLTDGPINEGGLRILPESLRYIPVYLKESHTALPFSVNFLKVTGHDSLGKVTFTYNDTFISIHPGIVGIFFGTVLLIILWRRKSIKRKEGSKKGNEERRKKKPKRV